MRNKDISVHILHTVGRDWDETMLQKVRRGGAFLASVETMLRERGRVLLEKLFTSLYNFSSSPWLNLFLVSEDKWNCRNGHLTLLALLAFAMD